MTVFPSVRSPEGGCAPPATAATTSIPVARQRVSRIAPPLAAVETSPRVRSLPASCVSRTAFLFPLYRATAAAKDRRLESAWLTGIVPDCDLVGIQRGVVLAQRVQFLEDLERKALAPASPVDQQLVQIFGEWRGAWRKPGEHVDDPGVGGSERLR